MVEGGRTQATVVVVDDDEATLGLISTFLRRNGYHVIAHTNPLKALESLETLDTKLVITDLMMPHVDGIAFTERLHQLPRHRHTSVILITAYGNDSMADQGLRRGVAMTLAKPIELSKLLDLVGFATS